MNFNRWSVKAIWNTGERYVALQQGNGMSKIQCVFSGKILYLRAKMEAQ